VDLVTMLEKAIGYVKFLQVQVKVINLNKHSVNYISYYVIYK